MPDVTLERIPESIKPPDNTTISPPDTILEEARKFWKYVKEHPREKKFRDEAVINLKYFTGEDQGWDEDGARATLLAEMRPALTLNRLHPIIRLITGARPKSIVTYIPSEQGKEDTAAILASCKEYIEDENKWEYQEDDALLLSILLKRVVIEIRPNYNRDVRGDIDLVMENPYNVYLDPDSEKRDRSDQQRMIVVKNVTKKEAIRTFPHKKAEIERFAGYVEGTSAGSSDHDTSPVDGYRDDSRSDYYSTDSKKISLIYYWYKTYERATKIIDQATGLVTDTAMSKAEVEKKLVDITRTDRFKVIEREFVRVNNLVFCHDIEFERSSTPWERADGQRTKLSDNFPFIIEELNRIVFGLDEYLVDFVAMLHDPAKYHNKLASSILHIINTQARGGYDYEVGALNETQKKQLESDGSKPGHNQEWDHMDKMKPRTPGSAPQAEMALAEAMSRELLDISGVESLISTQSLGKNASGDAIGLKQQQGGNIISWIYRAHSFFMHQLAEYERDAIQAIFDYEKVIRLRGDKPKYITINKKVYDQRGGVAQVLNDVTEGRFATRIRDKEDMPSIKIQRFRYFSELVKSGALQLPPPVMTKIVMELMDDPDLKDVVEEEMADFVKQQQQLAAQQAQQEKQLPPSIKENVDIDRLFPLLSRSEQVQILQELGIKPDMNATAAGLPDANTAFNAQRSSVESEVKMSNQMAGAQLDGAIKTKKADQDMRLKENKMLEDMRLKEIAFMAEQKRRNASARRGNNGKQRNGNA